MYWSLYSLLKLLSITTIASEATNIILLMMVLNLSSKRNTLFTFPEHMGENHS
ncbi:hypothetical protein Q4561_02835 [Alteromonas sp. 1_MG-2023]|uniref:hypothetical protein n=1 Tax=Alteromonas sp. 1_MG-2023 TaxID=3062669 RepID=UPI0026E34620|nr:hypothetical protein [Alteromonas sp. 1_MG-2023]MDO6565986.1 hypothetical protein [Alteromonas sp. 1_MG-2023]